MEIFGTKKKVVNKKAVINKRLFWKYLVVNKNCN